MPTKQDIEVQWLTNEIIPKILADGKLVNNYDESLKDTFKLNNIDINYIGSEESYMLTICYRARIAYEYDGIPHECSLVVKKTPQVPDDIFDSINFAALFSNEMVTYSQILPAIENFTREPFIVSKYYYGGLQRNSGVIILEDFTDQGWRMCRARADLSLEHILVAVKYLAKFHGIGFAMRNQNRKEFNAVTSKLLEARFTQPIDHPEWKLMESQSKIRLERVVREHQAQIPDEFIQRYFQLVNDSYVYNKQRVALAEPMVTLCHGDYLRNNIAFKYGTDDVPVDAMMFDLQTMRLSSPMIDLSVCLCLSAYARVRWSHFDEIFNSYCRELASTYTSLTGAPEVPDFLQRESLLKEYIRFLPYSMSIASYFLMVLVDPMELEDQLIQNRPEEEIIEDCANRGGDEVNRELSHQFKEMYELSVKYNVDIGEGIEL